jgi:cysteine sulfinate desulfinase/cysteine desulfurase-like protein
VALIVGMGKAAELALKGLTGYEKRIRPLRDALEEGILSSIPNTELNGHKDATARQHDQHHIPQHRIRLGKLN